MGDHLRGSDAVMAAPQGRLPDARHLALPGNVLDAYGSRIV
jgi:hypothetical protein